MVRDMPEDVAKFEFLTEQWIAKTDEVRAEFRQHHGALELKRMTINLVVTDCPFEDRPTADANLDSTTGEPIIRLGHLPKADFKITTSYDIAKSIFVDGQVSRAMEAVQLGRIKIDGSMLKMMGLAALATDKDGQALAKQIRTITA